VLAMEWPLPSPGYEDFANGVGPPPDLSFLWRQPKPAAGHWTLQDLLASMSTETHDQAWKHNNEAFKYFRWFNEHPQGVPAMFISRWDLSRPTVQVGLMEKKEGMDFTFTSPAVAGRFREWSWKRFLTQIREPERSMVIGCGIVDFVAACTLGSYDHRMAHAMVQLQTPYPPGVRPPIWEFVAVRADGSMMTLKPDWKGYQLSAHEWTSTLVERRRWATGPSAGYGRSDGRGTYKYQVWQSNPDYQNLHG